MLAYAGHPSDGDAALAEFDESLDTAPMSLNDPAREVAWAAFG